MAERSEAEALAFLLRIWSELELEAKIKHVAERSEAEALAFLLWIWPEIEPKTNPHGRAKRGRSYRLFVLNFTRDWSQNKPLAEPIFWSKMCAIVAHHLSKSCATLPKSVPFWAMCGKKKPCSEVRCTLAFSYYACNSFLLCGWSLLAEQFAVGCQRSVAL